MGEGHSRRCRKAPKLAWSHQEEACRTATNIVPRDTPANDGPHATQSRRTPEHLHTAERGVACAHIRHGRLHELDLRQPPAWCARANAPPPKTIKPSSALAKRMPNYERRRRNSLHNTSDKLREAKPTVSLNRSVGPPLHLCAMSFQAAANATLKLLAVKTIIYPRKPLFLPVL